ncbi:MAG: UvrD-helicase domain-containing protein [Bacteroidota bacterium]
MPLDLSLLNAAQHQAVTQTEGPFMINAGPGAGKTQVLTHRIAYLIQEQNIPPYHIMALTFTNKAAKEMTKRIQNLITNEARGLWIGTFHSLFSRLLRIESETLHLPRNFTIYDRADSLNLIKILIKELQLNEEIYKPNIVLNRISGAKNRLMDAQAYSQNPICREDDQKTAKPRMGEIFLQYENRCKKAAALDFDDLLLTTYQLLNTHQEIAKKYQDRFRYILVDEFQDTNQVQYAILKILAAHKNLCVIGDDAQSIYAFRGANIDNILSFTTHFSQAKTIKLEQNYRSTKQIVQAVNSLIAHNKDQLPKQIFTSNAQGAPISLITTSNEVEEALYVAKSIFDTSQQNQLHYDQFAVLYRTNSQSRIIEETLRKNNIPYQLLGGTSFYQRKEIKDLLAYLRLLVNPNDEQALRRVINLPKRGIGPTTLEKVWQWSLTHELTIWEVLQQIERFIQGQTAAAIKGFVQLIAHFQNQMPHKNPYEIALAIAEKSGLLTALYADQTPEGVSRYENIQELLNSIKSFVDENQNESNQLADFLEQISLLSNADQQEDGATPKVLLMTIHTAKGLEFPYL